MFSKIFLIFTLIFTQINALRSRTYILLQGTEENNATSSRPRRESSEEEKSKNLDGQTNSMDFVQMSRPIVGQAPADPCLLKCKDDYLLYTEPGNSNPMPSWRMDSAIGSPLHALIETVSAANSLDRMTMECNHQKDFLICLKRCGKSAARQILVDGQEAMKTVCQSFKKDKEFLHYVLPCLAKNGNRIGKSCQLHWSLMENDIYEAIQNRLIADQNGEGLIEGENGEKEEGVEDGFRRLCRAMSSYSDCHLKTVAHLCHRRAIPFFVRLNNKSSGSLIKMLIDWFDRPALNPDWLECEHWDPQKLLANESNGMGKSSRNIGKQILIFLFAIILIFVEFL